MKTYGIVDTLTEGSFMAAFKRSSRSDSFSYAALEIIYEDLMSIAEAQQENIEFDIIAICGEYNEYDNFSDWVSNNCSDAPSFKEWCNINIWDCIETATSHDTKRMLTRKAPRPDRCPLTEKGVEWVKNMFMHVKVSADVDVITSDMDDVLDGVIKDDDKEAIMLGLEESYTPGSSTLMDIVDAVTPFETSGDMIRLLFESASVGFMDWNLTGVYEFIENDHEIEEFDSLRLNLMEQWKDSVIDEYRSEWDSVINQGADIDDELIVARAY